MALSMMVLDNANLLIFDEPTNHLDVESIEVLEDALGAWGGTVLLVSHDRALLEALVTRVWVLHHARITDYPGTFVEWEEASKEREHAAAVAAAEDESSRRVEERKRTRRGDDRAKDERAALRAARETLTAAEARVAAAERKVTSLKEQMEDPALVRHGGGREARRATGHGPRGGPARVRGGVRGLGGRHRRPRGARSVTRGPPEGSQDLRHPLRDRQQVVVVPAPPHQLHADRQPLRATDPPAATPPGSRSG